MCAMRGCRKKHLSHLTQQTNCLQGSQEDRKQVKTEAIDMEKCKSPVTVILTAWTETSPPTCLGKTKR